MAAAGSGFIHRDFRRHCLSLDLARATATLRADRNIGNAHAGTDGDPATCDYGKVGYGKTI
jgi:hypothetical protein